MGRKLNGNWQRSGLNGSWVDAAVPTIDLSLVGDRRFLNDPSGNGSVSIGYGVGGVYGALKSGQQVRVLRDGVYFDGRVKYAGENNGSNSDKLTHRVDLELEDRPMRYQEAAKLFDGMPAEKLGLRKVNGNVVNGGKIATPNNMSFSRIDTKRPFGIIFTREDGPPMYFTALEARVQPNGSKVVRLREQLFP